MVRARSKSPKAEDAPPEPVLKGYGDRMDVNAIVSYNVREIRERRGWTQQSVAERLARFTGHELPQASISAMERGFDGDRRRRFDAHELYLLSMVFGVPIAYFFLPPPDMGFGELVDTNRPISEIYVALLGRENQLAEVDERLAAINVTDPATVSETMAALLGAENVANNWHEHFRTWRKKRLVEFARNYGDRLDDVAEFLAEFAAQVKTMGPRGYLEATAHRRGEPTDVNDKED